MKRFIALLLALICIFSFSSCLYDSDKLPILYDIESKSEEEINEILKGCTKTALEDKWGLPLYAFPSENAYIWSFSDEFRTITVYFTESGRFVSADVHGDTIPTLTITPTPVE